MPFRRRQVRTELGHGKGGAGVVGRWIMPDNFQLGLIWIKTGQGRSLLALGANGVCLDMFSVHYHLSLSAHKEITSQTD